MDYKMDFWKLFRMNFFQVYIFGFEIFEILQKCCWIWRWLFAVNASLDLSNSAAIFVCNF